ncbi:MAG: hypothetical protein AAGI23_21095 [Bacteroidota bacterium]
MSEPIDDQITVSLKLDFVKQLLHGLTLEQMQYVSAYLSDLIHDGILADVQSVPRTTPPPIFTPDMIVPWYEEENEEDEVEMTDEEFNKAVQDMS